MADAYLATRRETDRSQAAALASMSGSIREEINRVDGSVAGLSRQLLEQRQQIAALEELLAAAETHRIAVIRQLEWITNDLNSTRLWIKFGVVTIVLLLAGLIGMTVQIFRLK